MKGHDDISRAPARAYWTTAEVAERLSVDIDTVYAQAATGRLPHLRVGRAYRFPIEGVLEWERLQTIVNDGSATPQPKVRRVGRTRASKTSVFKPRPYTGPRAVKSKAA